jgi:hypothetical protein
MTTFTMQDLNNLPNTPEEDEAMDALAKLGGNVDLKAVFTQMGSDLTGGKSNVFDAPVPQPSGENPHNPDISTIINAICAQLQLLTSVISQAKAQPEAGENSLQECVSLTLQQADWFKEMVRGIIDDTYDFADYAENAVEHVVEKEVESYFDSSFNPEDHFDFGDAVSDAVDDRIDDIVSDKIDDAVDAYLTNATISISK